MVWFYGDDMPLGSNCFGCFQRVPSNVGSNINEGPTDRNVRLHDVPRLWFPLAGPKDDPAYEVVRVEPHGDAWFDLGPNRNEGFENWPQSFGPFPEDEGPAASEPISTSERTRTPLRFTEEPSPEFRL
jgi:hypothetical protein